MHLTCPNIRRMAILTGGGDCPGLNAVIRAVARDAFNCGIEVWGIEDGYLGLIENRIRPITETDISGILHRGGTILGSNNKSNPSKFPTGKAADGKFIFSDVTDLCVRNIKSREIEAVVIIGGDGTMTSAANFSSMGIPIVGVPKTIDNDIEGTEITFGFSTAVATATLGLDQVRTTADSHHRAMVVEVMGRNAGWIALNAGVASGSDVILLPEIPFDLEYVAEVVRKRSFSGKRSTLVCVSEGAMPKGGTQIVAKVDLSSPDPIRLGGIGKYLSDELERRTGVESRYVVLGHTQRGGTPVAYDRVLATMLGNHAMTLLRESKIGRLVAVQGGRFTDIPLSEPAGRQRLVKMDDQLIYAARAVGTSFGDET